MSDKGLTAAQTALTLPIYQSQDEIISAVRDHRVVVVEGPTGSGKTTQLPRMLLREGFAMGAIGVTQPRRIAAVSVAWRIAEEADVELGQEVGYSIRFDDKTSSGTMLKLMTDGILLQEARTDPLFSAYDIIMVDEAHERSLNIDLTLGLLHRALQHRDDLHVIVSSATIQPEVFQNFFADVAKKGEVPLISIEARTHPIEIEYHPPVSDAPSEISDLVAWHVARLHRHSDPGHILAFLTGEGMIRATETAIHSYHPGSDLVVLPLFGRLTREEQERIFSEFPGKRKVVLATNIAETSITIPDVRYVIDCGMAKIPRFNSRFGWQTLREESISKASADQRAGRAGRTAPGRVIRLYDEESYEARPDFIDEEILRLDLSEVVLRLINLGIHDVESFPFPTRPSRRKLADALESLYLLGAIDRSRELTEYGRQMVRYPLTPPLARMVVDAIINYPDVLDEALITAACLSTRSPFNFPSGEESEARTAHRKLADARGDIFTLLRAFRGWVNSKEKKSFCKRRYLDGDILSFISKAHGQLREIAMSGGVEEIGRGGSHIHLLHCIACAFPDRLLRLSRNQRSFETGGGQSISLHPSSSLYGERVEFVVATDIMKARRLYAFKVCVVPPEVIAKANPDLARRWRLRAARKDADAGVKAAPSIPEELVINGVTLPVLLRGNKARVEIPIHVVPKLVGADPTSLPPSAGKWRASIVSPHGIFAHRTFLWQMICLLPILPLPGPDADLTNELPEGALLEVDRNLHTIERHLGQLLTPMRPQRGPHPGWLMLVSNGAGGYWFEVTPDFMEALEVTAGALSDLEDGLPDYEVEIFRATVALRQQAEDRLEALRRSMRLARKHFRKGRKK